MIRLERLSIALINIMHKREEEDRIMRDLLASSAIELPVEEKDDHQHYTYSIDEGQRVRTCNDCKISTQFVPKDKMWVLLFTRERIERVCEKLDKGVDWLGCDLCGK